MSDDTPHRFSSAFKGVASGRTGVRGGPPLYNQLADDRDRARPAPTLARLAWLERPDPDSEHQGRLTTLPLATTSIVKERLPTPPRERQSGHHRRYTR